MVQPSKGQGPSYDHKDKQIENLLISSVTDIILGTLLV